MIKVVTRKETGKSWLEVIDFVWQPQSHLTKHYFRSHLNWVKSIHLQNVLDSDFKSSISANDSISVSVPEVNPGHESDASDVLAVSVESGKVSDVTSVGSRSVEMIKLKIILALAIAPLSSHVPILNDEHDLLPFVSPV